MPAAASLFANNKVSSHTSALTSCAAPCWDGFPRGQLCHWPSHAEHVRCRWRIFFCTPGPPCRSAVLCNAPGQPKQEHEKNTVPYFKTTLQQLADLKKHYLIIPPEKQNRTGLNLNSALCIHMLQRHQLLDNLSKH